MILFLSLLACKPAEQADSVDVGDPAPTLEIPDLSDVDLETAYADALALALSTNMIPVWGGHIASLDLAHSGCPDFFAGSPDGDLDIDEDSGVAWSDHCETSGGLFYSGWAWWDGSVATDDSVDGEEGQAIEATRTLDADATVGDDDGEIYAWEGEAADALSQESTEGWSRWTWSSTVTGTLAGRVLFDGTDTPDGWRADLYLYATGGDDGSSVEITGDIYYFDPVLQQRFDSVSLNLSWTPPDQVAPGACAEEPVGYLSVRDSDAFWYDLVFQPSDSDDVTGEGYPDDPYLACDGCGSLYVRGIAQDITVCPDLSPLWEEVAPPEAADYILTLRDLEAP